MAHSLLLLVSWIHAVVKPIGEWFSVSVLGAFEELTKVNATIIMIATLCKPLSLSSKA